MTTMMVMVMTMVVCVSAASLGGCRRDDVKVEGSHPENVSTSLKSHQDANETLDVSTRVDSHLNVNKTLEDSARITINQDVNRTMGDSKQDVTLNLPINETSITPLIILVRDCPLPTCLTHNLGSSLQHGDETAGRDASDPLGFGKK
ncbi:uncharacterized protein zgc:193726 isoform X4 [Acanthochromis polyacanthus]|uniref:uncharacterized protein zgc:193726 isoform X4 n=1 Tax=Acanthochromis polyacanthus TaxID=80966 RepID=UPI00223489AA|nr:uncharacterized protein zgc:193726 isoform X4 [Acanthochromis polyacanthus]